ncbi:MAG: AMP-binding protein, partial [Gammaproteobacteria bacterium]|nr:AMP-binding protein [Gammaproteobacteria bacterium]
YVVDNSDAEIVIADADYVGLFEEIRQQIPKVRDILIFDGLPGPDMQNMNDLVREMDMEALDFEPEGDASTMIYTSGTTGKPKGAVRGSGDPTQQAALLAQIGYKPEDVYLTTGPLYHSGPGGFAAIAHALGNTVVIQKKFQPEDWLRLVDRYAVTSTFSAPTPIRMVCQLDRDIFDQYDVSSMRIMIANAAPWSWALKMSYLERFPNESLYEVYGSTELGVNTILMPEDQVSRKGSCGKPAPGVVITLYKENGEVITEPNVPGEVFVQSASVYETYHKAGDKYEADRKGNSHTVGDIAYFDEDGFYYICDRKKDMIISGGMNIYPAEIEATLDHCPDVMDVAVIGIPSEDWGEAVHAIIVMATDSSATEEDIIAYAREHLAGYKLPRSVSFTGEIPRNGSGKILKKELRAPFWTDHENAVL